MIREKIIRSSGSATGLFEKTFRSIPAQALGGFFKKHRMGFAKDAGDAFKTRNTEGEAEFWKNQSWGIGGGALGRRFGAGGLETGGAALVAAGRVKPWPWSVK